MNIQHVDSPSPHEHCISTPINVKGPMWTRNGHEAVDSVRDVNMVM